MKVLITGGCGFIGTNIAKRHLEKGDEVIVIDNLSRPCLEGNQKWLEDRGVKLHKNDINDAGALNFILQRNRDIEIVYHMAAQTAVTKSIEDPVYDFLSNVGGTFKLLETIRVLQMKPFFIYASTNKVYGAMPDIKVAEDVTRYRYEWMHGIREEFPLDFHSPYGCSKGAAEQYVRDYARIYGLDTVVFRQSCIYGPFQVGVEDQGWLSWFSRAAISGRTINIFGTGKQVRDVLYIDDLLDLYDAAYANREITRGQIYNAGGGPKNTLSLLELIKDLEEIDGKDITLEFYPARAGDQKIYISAINKAWFDLDWAPKVSPKEGIKRLYDWTKENL